MTPNATTATNGQTPVAAKTRAVRAAKQPKRKTATRRKGKRAGNAGTLEGYSTTASRLFSRGTKAVGGAYEWAAEEAGRAIPMAKRHMPDQAAMLRMVDERPYVLGAIGLGIGALIGMMLPGRLSGAVMSQPSQPKRRAKRTTRKS